MILGLYDGFVSEDSVLLRRACDLAFSCSVSDSAYSVGSLLADGGGVVLYEAYSRMSCVGSHAEQEVLDWVRGRYGVDFMLGCTLYSSLQPCSVRLSHGVSCQEYIVRSGVGRLVYGVVEPDLFIEHGGDEILLGGGIVVEVDDSVLDLVRGANAGLGVF